MALKGSNKTKYQREYMKRKRSNTDEGVTVPASYVMGIDGKMYETLPERPRFLTLSDDQVLDRLNQPFGHALGLGIQEMRACNESSYNFKPRKKR